jgi:peptidyl-prolyl cis-trans isomerase C
MHYRKFLMSMVVLSATLVFFLPVNRAEESTAGSPDGLVIAKVGDKEIVFGDLNELIKMMPPSYQAMFRSDDQITKLLERQIDNILFAQEARRLQLDQDPTVRYKIEEFTKGILTQVLIDAQVNKSVTVTDGEIAEYYKKHQDEFQVPEKIKVSHILIAVAPDAPENEKKEKKAQAEEIRAKAIAGEDFSDLAKKYSEDTKTKDRGGVLGFFSKGSKNPELEKAAFSLKKDEVSSPILTPKGYEIVKLLDTKEATTKSLEESKNRISNKLQQEKRNDAVTKLLEDLKAKTSVVIYDDVIKKIAESSEAQPGN